MEWDYDEEVYKTSLCTVHTSALELDYGLDYRGFEYR